MTRQYFFPSGLFVSVPGTEPFRIRYFAREGDGVRIVVNGVPAEAKFKNGKTCSIKVTADKGPQGKLPFDGCSAIQYEPYVEFVFGGQCSFGKELYCDKEGLIVLSDGDLELDDPDGNFPFSAEQLAAASHVSLLAERAVDDGGPHWPSK